ncbi:hypothetical protein, partial [Neoroseomonas rubea]|uniref:hypothetical protein n=1 Tax=Neoroseomonas rubea TaxID=2748666 RepID=UPI001E654643
MSIGRSADVIAPPRWASGTSRVIMGSARTAATPAAAAALRHAGRTAAAAADIRQASRQGGASAGFKRTDSRGALLAAVG